MGTTQRRIALSWKVSTQGREHPSVALFQCPSRLGDTLRSVRAAASRVLVHAGRLRYTAQQQMSPLLHTVHRWPPTVDGWVLDEPALRQRDRRLGPQSPGGELE